jgi:hypothetical protein
MTSRNRLLLISFLFLALVSAPSFAGQHSLTGSWDAVTTEDGTGQASPTLINFNRSGTTIATPPSNNVSSANGSWKKTGARSFAATSKFFIYNAGGNVDLVATSNAEYELSQDGQEFTSTFETDIRTLGGVLIATVTGTITGERINVE